MASVNLTRRGVLAAGTAGLASAAGAIAVAAGGGALLSGCDNGTCKTWSDEYEPDVNGSGVTGKGLVALADIAVGGSVTARTPGGDPIIITRPTETTAVAFSAACPHRGCLVNPDGKRLRCPPHDAWFDATTGKVEDGPADKPLRRIGVAVVDGTVVLG